MPLTLDEANRMMQSAINKAKELNINMSIAVCDAGGHLLAFNRTEGCIWISAVAAQGKARTATGFARPSGEISPDSPVIQSIMATHGGMIPAQGAVPIFRGGELIGSIGGSGGTGQQDEDCAKAGLEGL